MFWQSTLAVDFDDFPAALDGRKALALKLCCTLLHGCGGLDAFHRTDPRKAFTADNELVGNALAGIGLLANGNIYNLAYSAQKSTQYDLESSAFGFAVRRARGAD